MKYKGFQEWMIFICLSVIWGSSFILMKEGLIGLSYLQVASVRIISSGIVLLPIALRNLKNIPKAKMKYVIVSGIMGSLIPAYLFCAAETGISSSAAGVLNSLTPVFVILFGVVFFKNSIPLYKIIGMATAFAGSIVLCFARSEAGNASNIWLMGLVAIATMCYGFNVNLVERFLKGSKSLHIVSIALASSGIPAFVVLCFSGFWSLNFSDNIIRESIFYSCLLGVGGTAIASFLFYVLLKQAGSVFASMVTYAMPVVALGWGLWYGESVNLMQVLSMVIILAGVYITYSKKYITAGK